jgi:hypothetical protein
MRYAQRERRGEREREEFSPTPLGGNAGGGEKRDADLPPLDPARVQVRAVADAPHLHDLARRVVDHYVLASGKPALGKPAGVVAVMDLLAWGVRPEILMRAADAYTTFARLHAHPPVGTGNFFAFDGDWREYCKGPPKPPPAKTWQPPPGESLSPEEVAEARRRLAARKTGKLAATGATPASPPPGPP